MLKIRYIFDRNFSFANFIAITTFIIFTSNYNDNGTNLLSSSSLRLSNIC